MLAVPMSFTIRRAWRALTPKRRSIDAHDSPPQRAATTLALRWARSCGLSLRVPLPRSIIRPRLGQKMTTSPIEIGHGPHGQELLGHVLSPRVTDQAHTVSITNPMISRAQVVIRSALYTVWDSPGRHGCQRGERLDAGRTALAGFVRPEETPVPGVPPDTAGAGGGPPTSSVADMGGDPMRSGSERASAG
jgi:hypothetical protein